MSGLTLLTVGLLCSVVALLARHVARDLGAEHTTPDPWNEDESA